ncbi:hypothetical protein [Salarchaeum japonicum]|uniref:hypothetical protein n=1 Tax=Salarchaeum japonicum TaxID=555573 RepID=UPI003C77B8B1
MKLRDAIGVSATNQRRITRAMQLSLIGIVFVGLDRGNPGIVVNGTIAFGVTYVPALLERDYNLPMDSGLVLWMTLAAFLHAVGTLGPYQNVAWWDHVTHALSSSLVAGAGYAFTRAVDEHSDDIAFPPRFSFALILLVVLAFGVFWEVLEFALSEAGNALGQGGSVLTQYGLEDTIKDLVYNTLGGVIVAIWGTAYLADVASAVRERFVSGE